MKFSKLVFIFLLCLGYCFSFSLPLKASTKKKENNNKITRVVALTSLTADIVNYLSNNSLVGIPGSSLLKENNDFVNKTIISSGRMPPNLEKIIKLKPSLVIGSAGFHDKTLKDINRLGIETISVSVKNFNDLEKLFFETKALIGVNNKLELSDLIPNCYNPNEKINNYNKEILVLVSSKPLLSPNSKSWAGNMINRFNHINITSELDSKSQFKGYVNLSPEWVVSSMPSNLITINTPGSTDTQYENMIIWNDLPAVINNKVFSFDYYGLINPGSLNSIDKACKKLSII